MASTHAVIYVAANAEQAHLLKNVLTEQGIFAYVTNEQLQLGAGELMGLPTAPRVVVDESDAEDARQIALEFEQALKGNALSEDSREPEDEESELDSWPKCPHCNRPRHTSCPTCETAGGSFPLAFMPPGTDGGVGSDKPQKLLVICPICDEPFSPIFLARCEWCGHRFGDGRELPVSGPSDKYEFNERVWIVIVGLVIALGAVFAIFANIARQS
jgi:hypothetical protein